VDAQQDQQVESPQFVGDVLEVVPALTKAVREAKAGH